MSGLILPSRFTQQPQIAAPLDLSDSLGRGLVHSWGLNVRGPNSAHDATLSAHGVFSTGNSWVSGASGSFINFNDGGAGPSAVAIPVGNSSGSGSPKNSTTWSFACRFRLLTTGDSQCLYGSTSGGIEIRIQPSSQIKLLKQQQVDMGTSTNGFAIGEDTDIVVTYNNGDIQFYVEGLPAGSASNAQTFNTSTQYYLGSSAFLGNGTDERIGNGGRIYKADVWNRVLSPLEVKSWSDNPWRTHKAPSRRLWVSGAAIAGITGTLYSSENSDTLSATGFITYAPVTSTVVLSEGPDTPSATVIVTVAGNLVSSETSDVLVSTVTANNALTATLSITEESTGAYSLASLAVSSFVQISESAEAVSSNTLLSVLSSLNKSEVADSIFSVASVSLVASSVLLEAPDTISAAIPVGSITIVCVLSEVAETVSSAAKVVTGASGMPFELADILVSSAAVLGASGVTGTAVITEDAHTVLSGLSVVVAASFSAVEFADSCNSAARLVLAVTSNLFELSDTLTAVGTTSGVSRVYPVDTARLIVVKAEVRLSTVAFENRISNV